MIFRIGAASSDGIVINEHFGHAESFHIIDLDTDNGKWKYAQTRNVTACCCGGSHEENSFERVIDELGDISALLVSRIGDAAANYVESKGIVVYEAPYPIDALIEKILNSRLWEVDKWQYHMTS